MANGTETEVEFIDCGSLSINYDATGKVTISLSIVANVKDVNGNAALKGQYDDRTWGDVDFDYVIMSANPAPIIGSRGWYQWGLQMEGIGNDHV
jgi:hypothetical protein